MISNKSLLAAGIAQALFVGAMVGSAPQAFAQDGTRDEATTLDKVQITGSRIRRVDAETASPVFVIDAVAIEKTGATTVGAFLQTVPAIAGAATNPSVNNGGGDGAATVSLRGLGEDRTLTLLDGRRMVYNDINSIPISVIERVEVLKDGASAIYGSDAIGGVVNFILKKDMKGGEVTVNYGISGEDDGQRQGANATYGWSGDRGNVLLSVNYNKQEEVRAADRDYSAIALTLSSGEVSQGGSSRTTTGRYVVPRTLAAANGINCSGTAANVALTRIDGRSGAAIRDFRCFNSGTDLFNYQGVGNLQLTPQERAGLFVSGNFDIAPGHTLYTQVYTQNTSSASTIAPLPFDSRPGQDEIAIPANSFYNPFGVAIPDLRLRLSAIGNRNVDFKSDVKQISSGIKGELFGSSWNYDVGFTYGKLQQRSTTSGYLLTPALTNALGASFRGADGVVRCGTPSAPISNCTPVNFFGALNDPTQLAALAQVAPNTTNRTDKTLKSVQADFTGDAFELPAGPVGVAIGAEYREESLNFSPDFLALINTTNFTCLISSEACTSPAKGNFDVKEFYGEAFIPILADTTLVRSLNATLGARYSDYSTFGNTTNWKVGLEWRPVNDVLLRGTVAKVFRAPQITDLFSGQSAASDSFSDPCEGFRGAPAGSGAAIACRNVPTDGSFSASDTQLSAIKGGNPGLQPEKGKVFTWGVVYDASWLPGFSTTADLWKVYLNDTIGTVGTQVILNNCFANGSFCNLFSRGTDGEILRLFDANANVGRTDTQGVDLGFKYRLGETDFGRFNFSLDTTYIAQYDVKNIVLGRVVSSQFLAGTFTNPSSAGLGNYSRWRSLGVVGWSMGPWEAQWTARYIDGFTVGSEFSGTRGGNCADASFALPPARQGGNPACSFRRGAQTYHNLQTGYTYEPWGTKFALGVDNAFDKQPPILYQNNTLNGNTDERTFDTVGRYFWLTATVAF